MSYSATGPETSLGEGARRQNAISLLLFLLICLAFLTRFCITPRVMNLFVDYTAETGAFYEKLHFGTYAIVALLPLALFARPIFLKGDEIGKFRALIRFIAILVVLVALLMVTGRSGASGFFIDTYLTAGAAGLIMFTVSEELRRGIGNVILTMLLLSAAIALFEVATEIRIMPFSEGEAAFRPTGLAEHPLTLGMMCAAAIGFVAVTRWRILAKIGAILLLFIGCAASGARFALLLASVEIFALLIFVPWTRLSPKQERQAKLVVILVTLVVGAALVAALLAGGLLSRFAEGIFDENAMSRITVYQVFSFTSLRDVLFGADLNEILKLVNEKLKLPYIESTPVILIYLLGLPLALVFAGLVFWIFARLLRYAERPELIGIIVFFVAALSNNTLSTKTPTVAIFIVLLAALANGVPPIPYALRREAAAAQ